MRAAEAAPANIGSSKVSGNKILIQAGVKVIYSIGFLPCLETAGVVNRGADPRPRKIEIEAPLDVAGATANVAHGQHAIMEKLALDPQAPSLKLSGFKCAARWPDNIQTRRAFRARGAQRRIGQRAIEQCDRVDERQVVHRNVLSK